MKTAIVNLATIVTGDWRRPFAKGDSILMNKGRIAKVGTVTARDIETCDVVLDADGMTAMPGMIDSQVHIAFADYTPRQRTIGFLESYLHGGTTTSITASEVHVPGRPSDPEGVKALAVTAKKCFDNYRPGGMRVHGGAIILEPYMAFPLSRDDTGAVFGLMALGFPLLAYGRGFGSVAKTICWVLGAAGVAVAAYQWIEYTPLLMRAGDPTTLDLVFGCIAVSTVSELWRNCAVLH